MHQIILKRVIILIFVISFFNTKGQAIYTYNACNNILYRGIQNILYVDFCGHNDSVFLLTENGLIEKIDSTNNLQYIWKSTDTSHYTTNIFLYNIIENDTVLAETFLFKIYDIPLPIFFLASKSGGKISKKEIIRSPVVQVFFDRNKCILSQINVVYSIVEFSYFIFSKEGIKHYYKKASNRFNTSEIEDFKKLEQGDILLFYNIYIIAAYFETPVIIAPSEFVIE